MPDKDTTPPDHTDLSELQRKITIVIANKLWAGKSLGAVSKMGLDKWQDAIDEILALFKQYAQPPVVADNLDPGVQDGVQDVELDEILTSLDAYRLNQGITTGGVSFTVEEHYAMYPELEKAKAALLQREQRLVAEAEKAARKKIVLHFRKVAQFQKDRGYGCERILGETDIMARNDWQIDERYRDE